MKHELKELQQTAERLGLELDGLRSNITKLAGRMGAEIFTPTSKGQLTPRDLSFVPFNTPVTAGTLYRATRNWRRVLGLPDFVRDEVLNRYNITRTPEPESNRINIVRHQF